MSRSEIGKTFIVIGYVAGIAISFLGLLASAGYLLYFIVLSPDPAAVGDIALTAERRLQFLSTAIFVGMCFGFLGFALFLIQAEGDTDAEVSVGDYKLKFARLSPGLFVIVCATVIIVVAVTFRIKFSTETEQYVGAPEPNAPTQPNVPDCEILNEDC